MKRTEPTRADRTDATELRDLEYYLPATPNVSTDPGPVERFLTSLFRRRGSVRPVDEDADDTAWR